LLKQEIRIIKQMRRILSLIKIQRAQKSLIPLAKAVNDGKTLRNSTDKALMEESKEPLPILSVPEEVDEGWEDHSSSYFSVSIDEGISPEIDAITAKYVCEGFLEIPNDVIEDDTLLEYIPHDVRSIKVERTLVNKANTPKIAVRHPLYRNLKKLRNGSSGDYSPVSSDEDIEEIRLHPDGRVKTRIVHKKKKDRPKIKIRKE